MSRRDALLLLIVLFASMLYLWTIATSGTRPEFGGDLADYYGELTTGFLHGELSIPMRPAQALLSTPNPYDPTYNAPWRPQIEDLALYHGRFYLDWGPTPVLTLYLPWRIMHLGSIPESWALWIYSVGGLAFAMLLYRSLVTTYVPRARGSRVVLGAVALALSNVIPFIDRTPDIYEVAVACGYCFLMLGFYLLASGGLGGRRSLWRLGLGSLALGLAAGARWDLLLTAGLVVPLCAWLLHRDRGRTRRDRAILTIATLGPCVGFVALLLAYNFARFGNPLEVGTTYQLAGHDATTTQYYQLGYLRPSLFYYLIAPVRLSLAFPYVVLPPPPNYPGAIPTTYWPEAIGGIFTTTPVLLMLLGSPFVGRRRVSREWRWCAALLVIVAAAIVSLLALGIPGGSMRYEVDFATLLLLPALLTWLWWEPMGRWCRRAIGAVGAVLIAFGAIIGFAISITGYRSQIFHTAPGQVAAIEDVTEPFADAITRMLGHPVLASLDASHLVIDPTYFSLGTGYVDYAMFGEQPIRIQALSPDNGVWTLSISLQLASGVDVPKNTQIYVVLSDRSGRHRFVFDGLGTLVMPAHLSEGRNTLTLTALGSAPALRHVPLLMQASGLALGSPELQRDTSPDWPAVKRTIGGPGRAWQPSTTPTD